MSMSGVETCSVSGELGFGGFTVIGGGTVLGSGVPISKLAERAVSNSEATWSANFEIGTSDPCLENLWSPDGDEGQHHPESVVADPEVGREPVPIDLMRFDFSIHQNSQVRQLREREREREDKVMRSRRRNLCCQAFLGFESLETAHENVRLACIANRRCLLCVE